MRVVPMICSRVAVTLVVIVMCSAKFTPSRRHKQSPAYPLEVHQMFRERLSKSDKPRPEGVWSPWSSWTPCSRSCGGGVTQQIRHCVPKPSPYSSGRENQRRRRRKRKLGNHCIGLYKRFHLCNSEKCSGGRDFRMEQCASFNKNPFKGKYYHWEPFLQASDECALNCRPVGMRFFATLNKTVVDGTSCMHPLTATGKAAPPGTPGVCIDGRCKSVASNGVIGSIDDAPEECSVCLKGSCRSVSGLYTKPDLSPGYSLVAQIPQGACRIVVQQLKHTKNILALRNANGSFIINGDWKFSPSRSVEGAGAHFTYRKQDTSTLETITASGPVSNPVDIMILYQQPNLGIKYGYTLPVESTSIEQIAPPYVKRPTNPIGLEPRRLDPPLNSVTQRDEARPNHTFRRRVRRRFSWKISGVSACSKSCGGGMQTTIFSCVREHTQTTVPDKRCSHLERPLPQQIRCNIQACSAYWGGIWGPCTGSCGQGVQHFVLQCQQEASSGQTLVINDATCLRPKPIASSRPCRLAPCENESDNELHQNPDADNMVEIQEWKVGPWSQCSVSCGTGQRTRPVSCLSGRCPPEKRPSHAEYCESGSCAIRGHISSWLVSDWSQCSEACGTGTQTRSAVCGNNACEAPSKPETQRACSSDRYCVGEWFVGPWGTCSDSCSGSSKQIREVMCIVKVRGHSRITNEMTCPVHEKPPTERLCQGGCPPRWFVGEWGICDGNCPMGTQRREVKCMERNAALSNTCADSERPVIKRPCTCEKRDEQMNKPAQDEPQDHTCVDKFSNCYLAVQARLCQYTYYISNCCVSCRKALQDSKQ